MFNSVKVAKISVAMFRYMAKHRQSKTSLKLHVILQGAAIRYQLRVGLSDPDIAMETTKLALYHLFKSLQLIWRRGPVVSIYGTRPSS